jgi:hypothetical protein
MVCRQEELTNQLICSADLETGMECPCCAVKMNQAQIKIDSRFLHWLKKYDEDVETFVVDENGVDRLVEELKDKGDEDSGQVEVL